MSDGKIKARYPKKCILSAHGCIQVTVIQVWDMRNWTCLQIIEAHSTLIYYLVVMDDKLVAASHDRVLSIWQQQ
jgi:hypothetical protein